MKVNLSVLQFDLSISGISRLPEKLRGFFGRLYREQELKHLILRICSNVAMIVNLLPEKQGLKQNITLQ